jgi:hypothetical protein
VNGAATDVKPRGRREFFGPPRDFMRRRVYGFPRLTNRHRLAFPSTDFFAEPTRGMGGPTIRASPRDSVRNSPRCRERERNGRALPPARVYYDFMRDTGKERGGLVAKGACHNAKNRLWEITEHRGARRGWQRFYPTFKQGQQMPWHVRSTLHVHASRRTALDATG